MKKLVALVVLTLALAPGSPAAPAPAEPGEAPPYPLLAPDAPVGRVVVKFHEGTHVRLRDGVLQALDREAGEEAQLAARRLAGRQVEDDATTVGWRAAVETRVVAVRRLFSADEEILDERKAAGEARSGRPLADLNLFFSLELEKGASFADVEDLLADLNALPSVEQAYAEPFPTLAVGDIPPPTPLLQGGQGYLAGAPTGIGATFAWTLPGGRGQGVKIVDVELNLIATHEDLPALFHNVGGFSNDFNHGTAVIGELAAPDNGYGVTGIAHGAQVGFVGLGVGSIPDAVTEASLRGDVVLIELQYVVSIGLVPVEFFAADFAAVQTATASGDVVVEAAANGGLNLDDPALFGQLFDRNVRDSGAIFVGASLSFDRIPAGFSNYGSRLDVHGWGENVVTTGYGNHPDFDAAAAGGDARQFYTASFSGTSSASPMAAGAAAILLGVADARQIALDPGRVRQILADTGTPQTGQLERRIGPLPNLQAAIARLDDQPPVASFTASCAIRTCSFNAGGSTDDVGITAYAWDFGDGATGSGVTTTHTYASVGTFTVRLTVTDTRGQTGTTTRQVTTQQPFDLALAPASVTIPAGGGVATYGVTLTRNGGFAGPVSLAVAGLPFDSTGSFNPNPVTGTSATLTVAVTAQTLNGSSTLTVSGTGGSPPVVRSASATLVNNLSCPFTFTPPVASVGSEAATHGVAVAVHSGCAWRATSNDFWISVAGGGLLTGNANLSYTLQANTGTKSRTGTLTIGRSLYSITQAQAGGTPVPILTRLTPASAAVGSAFTLTVEGAGFLPSSTVRVNGQDRTTTFLDANRLSIAITAADTQSTGSLAITVSNPAPGGGISNNLQLAIQNAAPFISAISPANVTAGSPGFTLQVFGSGFLPSSVIQVGGANRTTTFLNAGHLTTPISAADIASAGPRSVRVVNPPPGGGTSNAATLQVLPSNLPPAPTDLVATALSNSQIRLTWIDQSSNETGFHVFRKTGGGSFALVASTAANATLFTDSGLAAGTTYVYHVRAGNAVGFSAPSNEATATTLASTAPPTAPTSLFASQPPGFAVAELFWTDTSGTETSFRVERREGQSAFVEIAVLPQDTTTYWDPEVFVGFLYGYRVRACNAGGCSAYSNESTVVINP